MCWGLFSSLRLESRLNFGLNVLTVLVRHVLVLISERSATFVKSRENTNNCLLSKCNLVPYCRC